MFRLPSVSIFAGNYIAIFLNELLVQQEKLCWTFKFYLTGKLEIL